jgi:hypothetical protein
MITTEKAGVISQIERMAGDIETLHDAIDELSAALAPVLLREQKDGTAADNVRDSMGSEIADNLMSLRERINTLTTIVRTTTQSVDL